MNARLWIGAVVLAGAAGLMGGCAHESNMNAVRLGMSKADVLVVLGKPTSTSAQGTTEYLRYRYAVPMHGPEEYYVRLVAGKVEAFGKVGDFDSTKDPTVQVKMTGGK
jgi:hypothetical protein